MGCQGVSNELCRQVVDWADRSISMLRCDLELLIYSHNHAVERASNLQQSSGVGLAGLISSSTCGSQLRLGS